MAATAPDDTQSALAKLDLVFDLELQDKEWIWLSFLVVVLVYVCSCGP